MSTAFTYLLPARDRANLTVQSNAVVDRVLIDGNRATSWTTETYQTPFGGNSKPGVGLVVEARDVSEADAPSVVVARTRLDDVPVEPGGSIPFELEVPEVGRGRSLSLRAHASPDCEDDVRPGDLLTTASYPVAPSGPQPPVTVRLTLIR